MAIAKKPARTATATSPTSDERAAEAFIAAAGAKGKNRLNPTTLRFDPDLLRRIDAAAKRRGIKRTPWIMYAISRALDDEV